MEPTNYLFGDANDITAGRGGDDTLTGGKGGTNYLIGDAANAIGGPIQGGADRLVSADNTTDHMWGDFQSHNQGQITGGADTFVFGPRNGDDFIYDFHQGEDIIEIDASKAPGHFPETFSDLNIDQVDTDGSGTADSSIIHFDAHNSVTVLGVTNLAPSDFDFILVLV